MNKDELHLNTTFVHVELCGTPKSAQFIKI